MGWVCFGGVEWGGGCDSGDVYAVLVGGGGGSAGGAGGNLTTCVYNTWGDLERIYEGLHIFGTHF